MRRQRGGRQNMHRQRLRMAQGGVANVAGADPEFLGQIGSDVPDPEFIDYLINKAKHETYFLVGKDKTKIGAVKLMLAAHSDVLRSELLDSPLAEKGNIYLEDISPRTFKNLLRYVYGYNTISNLLFDEADDLLYAADKYLIKDLKAQLASRLMDLLDYTNICRLLNNPACHTVLELDAKITEILQYETDAVFESPDFINLKVEGFIKLLEQDALVVSELEVWRAALKWAKNQVSSNCGVCGKLCSEGDVLNCAGTCGKAFHTKCVKDDMEGCSEDGSILRKYISQLKHIRIRTFKLEDFCKEIVPTNILSCNELVQICTSHGKGEPIPCIMGFSDNTDLRQIDKNEFKIEVYRSSRKYFKSSFTIKPKCDIALLAFEFKANRAQSSTKNYQCECTIEINSSISRWDPKETVKFNEMVDCGKIFKVPLPSKCRRLSSYISYTIKITFNLPHKMYESDEICTCESFSLESLTTPEMFYNEYSEYEEYYAYHFSSLKYLKLPSK